MVLSTDDLELLTNRRRASAQRAVLEALHIPYTVRPDGSLLVLRAAVEAALKVRSEQDPRPVREPQMRLPNATA